jgi:high-affinity nickel-transport protein
LHQSDRDRDRAEDGTVEGLRLGLLVTAYGLGFRHGIDWDHIAAITDIAGTQSEPRDAMRLATLYAAGHAVVVFCLGVLAIAAGDLVPASFDSVMERLVGVTLVALGVWVLVSLARQGRQFRMQSRWMLLFSWVRGARRRLGAPATEGARGTDVLIADDGDNLARHPHPHPHAHPLPDRAGGYGSRTAFGVGMLHGVGGETPTQVLIFLAAAGAGGTITGVVTLGAFIVGLLTSNSLIAATAAFGFLRASRSFTVYASVAVVTGGFSLVVGALLLAGRGSVLPAIFGG